MKENLPSSEIDPRAASFSITNDALGQSEAFLDFQERLSRVASIHRPILLLGERGTGKELAATRLHYLSSRWQGPFISLNCAALAQTLIETELFGHEKGAFTGALQQREGRFEAANGGTLFLDEIGTIPMEVQEKILRVVEYGTFERVGGTAPVEVDVRIIGATNADLVNLAEKGKFKKDLLDRLSFEVLFLPPLRKRKGDILMLANHFAQRMAYELGREKPPVFTPAASEVLESHTWEGNIRELKNVVERSVCRADTAEIMDIILDPFCSPYAPKTASKPSAAVTARPVNEAPDFMNLPLKSAVKNLEIYRLERALEATKHNQKNAARILGLTYNQFRGLQRKYAHEIT